MAERQRIVVAYDIDLDDPDGTGYDVGEQWRGWTDVLPKDEVLGTIISVIDDFDSAVMSEASYVASQHIADHERKFHSTTGALIERRAPRAIYNWNHATSLYIDMNGGRRLRWAQPKILFRRGPVNGRRSTDML